MPNNSTDSSTAVNENFALTAAINRALTQIESYWFTQRQVHQRSSITLVGSRSWQTALLNAATNNLAGWPSDIYWLNQHTNRQSLRHQLGQTLSAEQAGLVVDLNSGIDIESVAIATGLLAGGGVCCWLMPAEPSAITQATQATPTSTHPLANLLSFPWQAQDLFPTFDNWGRDLVSHPQHSLVIYEDTTQLAYPLPTSQPAQNATLSKSSLPHSGSALTEEQTLLLTQMFEKLQHNTQINLSAPLVLSGERGRGKSTLLGHLINQLLAQQNHKDYAIALCSARPDQHQQAWLALTSPHQARVKRWAPDALINEQPRLDLLIIDEAAYLPWPQLQTLIGRYPACIISSTESGYEGSGQAWQQHLRPWLNHHYPNWQGYQLTQPLRWQANDPLEHLVGLLSGHTLEINQSARPNPDWAKLDLNRLSWQCASPQALSHAQRAQVFVLLTDSHYQTRPRDWQLLCSAPNLQLGLIWLGEELIGALWAILEGPLPDWGPHRRLQGHLVTQKLRQHHQTPELYSGRYGRCTRIAIAKPYRHQGLGKQLVAYWQSHPANSAIDSFTVSFGATPTLWRFWSECGFHTLHLGVQPDAASGRCNLMMMTPPKATNLAQAYQQIQDWFKAQWPALQHEYHPLSHDLVSDAEQQAWQSIWQTHPDWQIHPWQQISNSQRQLALQDYAQGLRPYEAISGLLIDWFKQQPTAKWQWPEAALWQWKGQGWDWSRTRQAWSQQPSQAHPQPLGRKGLEGLLKTRLLTSNSNKLTDRLTD
ncbi:GNAT family N-acetyltransferase [Thiomicrospira sp. ALE5]|uniref:GNAT family N-acetyltransferase n=1 Tax=Thiomicrospira sp. ALE5 TaxID=748650 RepID=UPI0008EEDD4C|nr:GNAT family N-acetyltransferase [Thiomicrospira sp. ALE5]SFR64022.1 tRNA(Met) cytidine acetyltransferase [Thiomicrospira sp. ALE5]